MAFSKLAKDKPAPKSKSKTPVIEIDDEEVCKAMASLKGAKQAAKTAKADIELAETVLLPVAMAERRNLIQEQGAHVSAVKLKTGDAVVTCKPSKKYSAIPMDSEKELREIFKKKYDDYFTTKTTASINASVLKDEALCDEIEAKLGEELFAEIFDVGQVIVPKGADLDVPPLVRDRDLNPEVAEMHDRAVEEGLVKPQKPGFTV